MELGLPCAGVGPELAAAVAAACARHGEQLLLLDLGGNPLGDQGAATACAALAGAAALRTLRLDDTERDLLHLLEGALNVSDYTDKVDVISRSGKNQRVANQLIDMLSILSGLLVSSNFKYRRACD